MSEIRISDAALMLGVSDDTVRRWIEIGKLTAGSPGNGPRTVSAESLALYMRAAYHIDNSSVSTSARNRFPGIVTRVEKDGVMALVEIQAGPHRVTSLLSRESVEELGLAPGVRATGVVKSTNVVIELEQNS